MVRTRHLLSEEPPATEELLETIRLVSQPLRTPADLDPLVDRIGNAHFVLLGEASHGTHEFYLWRDIITRRLIEEKGFSLIAVEGDWPDCYRVNRYLKGYPDSGDNAEAVLRQFERWPTWMWANREVTHMIKCLRQDNDQLPEEKRVGFYGLDVYSLWDSLYQVMGYLRKYAPASLPMARRAFQCFGPYGEDVHEYARATRWVEESCEDDVVNLLAELRHLATDAAGSDREAQFNAEQNALVVKNAEHYYRTMIQGGPESWNIRDRHTAETLERLMRYHGAGAKVIVWEHNTHIGDARFTDMAREGMVNVGQLVRESHAAEGVVLVGFGSYQGEVIAADEWEAPQQRMPVPPGRPGSWEDVLHQAGEKNRLLLFDEVHDNAELLKERGHRAIGVVYHPNFESYGNYVPTVLPLRYDAFLFFSQTQALQPLHGVEVHDEGEVPETYPSGV